MARKSAKNSGGCASAIGGVFLIGLGIAVVSGVFNIIKCIFIGVKLRYPYILGVIALYCFYRLGYYLTHRKPLTYEQIKRLARRNAEKYVKETYRFKKEAVVVDPNFKAALDVTGRWYEIEEPVATFPAYVAALLKGKHHEWVVIAVERNGCVCSFWANKGEDSESVSFNCDIDEIIQKCKELGGYSVFRFHNHPNPDPAHYTTLLASAQDKLSAASCAQAVCQHGINWFDFVCARGDYIQFYSQISDDFEVDGQSTSDIIDKISITPEMDYALQKEYSQSNHLGMLLKHVVVAILVIVLLGSSFLAGNKYVASVNKGDDDQVQDVVKDSSNWETAELEEFEYKYENGGITLLQYHGSNTSIIIPASFNVENTELPVLELDGTFGNNNEIENLVIPDGVIHVQYTTFAKTDSMKHLYIPASMTGSETIFEDFTDGEILYYGGTEEQWHELCYLTKRSDVSFKKLVFEASPDDCIANINTMVDKNAVGDIDEAYTPLTSFEYDTINGEITIGHHIGEEDFVVISPEYYVDGSLCAVVGLDNTFTASGAKVAVIPEGVQNVTQAVFNAPHIETIYLPKSLVNVPEKFWGYFHDIDTLYYGGTEEQFEELCVVDRWSLDVKHVVYEASPDDVPTQ